MPGQELTQFYLAYVSLLLSSKVLIIKVANKYGLTIIQALTLMAIDPEHPPTMQNLATIFCCDASNVTGIIDGLESKNLVSRQEKTGDRRVKIVKLEEKGEALRVRILHEAAGEQGQNFFSGLSSDEFKTFAALVTKIASRCPMQQFLADAEKSSKDI